MSSSLRSGSAGSDAVAPSRPSARAERTRQRIVEAAAQCFASAGYAKTTVEELALKAGVSKGLVYHHFGDKEGVLEAVLDRTLADWDRVSGLDAAVDLATAGDARGVIARMHRQGLAFARENPLLQRLIELDGGVLLNYGDENAVRRSMDTLRATLVDVVRAGIRSGSFRRDLDAERAADVILVLELAFIRHALEPGWIDVSDDRLIETGLDLVFRGLLEGAT